MPEEIGIQEAKAALDSLIAGTRAHFYKPIQIAEILFRDRTFNDIDTHRLETYRTASKKWRDEICLRFIGRKSSSSSKFQDDLFNESAIPPTVLSILAEENRRSNGLVEAYIYRRFANKTMQFNYAFDYVKSHDRTNFSLNDFLNLFWHVPGLKRSIDKVFEIVVYSLFDVLVEALNVQIEVSYDIRKNDILVEFNEFAEKVLNLSNKISTIKFPAKVHRVGVTNAADRGLDMYANFGVAIQIKHLSLTPELAEGIAGTITSDRIVIVCKEADKNIIISILTQIGWRARIQSIITEDELLDWYEKALRGRFGDAIGNKLLENLVNGIEQEFPATEGTDFNEFMEGRGYSQLTSELWRLPYEEDVQEAQLQLFEEEPPE